MLVKKLPVKTGGRLFAIGELYGHFPALGNWMREVSFKPQLDKVILLGNFLGYAASSRQAHHYLSQPWLEAVLGRNEVDVLARLDSGNHQPAGTLIGQWLSAMTHDERALLHRTLGNVAAALEWESEEGLVVFSNRPVTEESPWDKTRQDLNHHIDRVQALGHFMTRIGALKCLGMIPGGPQHAAQGLHMNISSLSVGKPAATHHVRHNRVIVPSSACTAHGAQYEHQSLLCSIEINHLLSSTEQVNPWETSLDVRHVLYPASNLNTSMH